MARLLRDLDYLRLIENDELLQIIEERPSIKLDVEQAGQSEMISYLTQRYIVSQIFTNTTVFDLTATYKGKNLVEYTAPAWSDATNYTTVGTRIVYNGFIYELLAPSNGSIPEDNPSLWSKIVEDKTLYFITLPKPEWSDKTEYIIGSEVWYLDKVYTALVANKNVVPDSSTAFWGTGVLYSVSGVLPTDATKWTKGDNRNQQIVQYLIDIVLFNLHSRLNPRNIPDLRKERYNGNSSVETGGAIGWLKNAAKGLVTADLPVIIPTQGLSILWGSNTKNNNTY